MNENPISIGVSAKAELKGEVPSDALGRAVHALVDAVSPFTEGLGLIGDHLRAHRYDVAIKIATRARQIAEESNRTISPPPLKFMVPYLEKASTETEDEELHELWARLLVDACDEFHGAHLTYIQILSEISGIEARYLDTLGRRYKIDMVVPPAQQIAEQYEDELAEHFSKAEAKMSSLRQSSAVEYNFEQIFELVYDFQSKEICRPASVGVPFLLKDGQAASAYKVKGDHATIAYLLQRQGLVQVETCRVTTFIGALKIELVCLTPLGADFAVSCMDCG